MSLNGVMGIGVQAVEYRFVAPMRACMHRADSFEDSLTGLGPTLSAAVRWCGERDPVASQPSTEHPADHTETITLARSLQFS